MNKKWGIVLSALMLAILAANITGLILIVQEERRQTNLATAQVEIAELHADLVAYKTILERNPDVGHQKYCEYFIAEQAQNVIAEIQVIHGNLGIKQRDGIWLVPGESEMLKYKEGDYNSYKGLDHPYGESQIVEWLDPFAEEEK